MRYEPKNVAADFERLFGKITVEQAWFLVKLGKHIRLRCRNNSAFNNFMGSCFPSLSFRTVNKVRKDGTTYPGLSINGVEADDSEE